MPMLKCSATTCLYNQEEYCSKGDIVVSGEQASRRTMQMRRTVPVLWRDQSLP